MSDLKCPKCKSRRTTTFDSGKKKCLDCNNEWGISHTNSSQTNSVYIKDIKMNFSSMVIFLIKLALASIPALIILIIIDWIFAIILGTGAGIIFSIF